MCAVEAALEIDMVGREPLGHNVQNLASIGSLVSCMVESGGQDVPGGCGDTAYSQIGQDLRNQQSQYVSLEWRRERRHFA